MECDICSQPDYLQYAIKGEFNTIRNCWRDNLLWHLSSIQSPLDLVLISFRISPPYTGYVNASVVGDREHSLGLDVYPIPFFPHTFSLVWQSPASLHSIRQTNLVTCSIMSSELRINTADGKQVISSLQCFNNWSLSDPRVACHRITSWQRIVMKETLHNITTYPL